MILLRTRANNDLKDLIKKENCIYRIPKLKEALDELNEVHKKNNHRGLDVMIDNMNTLNFLLKFI